MIADVRAVLYNLGFQSLGVASHSRAWTPNSWEDWYVRGLSGLPEVMLFQVKAFKNGNLHFRFMPDAIKAINVEAGRLLGWLRGPRDVEEELGYTAAEAQRFYSSMKLIVPASVKLLEGSTQ